MAVYAFPKRDRRANTFAVPAVGTRLDSRLLLRKHPPNLLERARDQTQAVEYHTIRPILALSAETEH